MLAEFLIELRLHEEQDKIAQIVTGSSSTVKHSMYDEYINASKGKVLAKGKGKQKTIGSQEGALRVTIVLTFIQGSSRADVQSADRLVILPHSVLVQLSPKPRMLNGEESTWSYEDEEWYSPPWESAEYEASKGKKGKGKGSKPKGKSKGKNAPRSITPKPSQSSPSKGNRSQPNPKPEARSCMTNDFLFAMMSTSPSRHGDILPGMGQTI